MKTPACTEDEIDIMDFTIIMDTLADMSVISVAVLTDVVSEITAHLDGRAIPEPEGYDDGDYDKESLADIASAENHAIDSQEYSHINRVTI